jgi:dihydroxy-acid dehydratase
MIALDVEARSLNVLISDEEFAKRRAAWTPPKARYARGWAKLYVERVTQADEGADLDFLGGDALLEEPEIF